MEPLRNPCIYALNFDKKLENYLKQQIDKLLAELPFRWVTYLDKYRHELYFISQLLLHSFSSLKGPSAGQALMGLNYENCQRWKRVARFIAIVILPYCFGKLATSRWKMLFQKFSSVIGLIGVMHYLYFLRYGGYCTLTERILGLRNIQTGNLRSFRSKNTNLINKEILLHVFRELMFVLFPIYMRLTSLLRHYTVLSDNDTDGDILHCCVCHRPAILPIRNTAYEHTCYYCHYVTE
uniref:RING-type E3 ubiquitin transferase (cysteine targeting) n=1 Tax=Syphacia muris TaxID=451379 RepID=A0A0N5AQ70_9BILA